MQPSGGCPPDHDGNSAVSAFAVKVDELPARAASFRPDQRDLCRINAKTAPDAPIYRRSRRDIGDHGEFLPITRMRHPVGVFTRRDGALTRFVVDISTTCVAISARAGVLSPVIHVFTLRVATLASVAEGS